MDPAVLVTSIKSRDLKKVEEALESGAQVNDRKNEYSPLLEALRFSTFDICSLLIEKGARLRRNGKERGYARIVVSTWANEEQIRHFIEAGVIKSGCRGFGPLHKLAKEGKPHLFKMYIDLGERIMGKTVYFTGKEPLERVRENKTPLHYAAMAPEREYNERECFEHPRQLREGELMRTPRELENIKAGKLEVAKLLIRQGADPNALDRKKCAPLFYAARDRFHAMVELLLDYGADPRIGKNPAVAAYMQGDLKLAERIEINRT